MSRKINMYSYYYPGVLLVGNLLSAGKIHWEPRRLAWGVQICFTPEQRTRQ